MTGGMIMEEQLEELIEVATTLCMVASGTLFIICGALGCYMYDSIAAQIHRAGK